MVTEGHCPGPPAATGVRPQEASHQGVEVTQEREGLQPELQTKKEGDLFLSKSPGTIPMILVNENHAGVCHLLMEH